jgi:hypothetical protein
MAVATVASGPDANTVSTSPAGMATRTAPP